MSARLDDTVAIRMPLSLGELNAQSSAAVSRLLAPIFENAPWVAKRAAARRPFPSVTSLHETMMAEVGRLDEAALLAFLRGHPPLSPEALQRGMAPASVAEQSAAGLASLDTATASRLAALNAAYSARFGFPFILAVRYASVATILAAFERRLVASHEAERRETLAEIGAITWMRLLDRVRPAPTGGLSTHVLDTVRAGPAVGLGVELWSRAPDGRMERKTAFVTDQGGSHAGDVLGGGALTAGVHVWRYDTDAYFAANGYPTNARAFLGRTEVSFTVWNPEEHYHVPLLLAPGSYTAYRGS